MRIAIPAFLVVSFLACSGLDQTMREFNQGIELGFEQSFATACLEERSDTNEAICACAKTRIETDHPSGIDRLTVLTNPEQFEAIITTCKETLATPEGQDAPEEGPADGAPTEEVANAEAG